jgi:hypothetical protein
MNMGRWYGKHGNIVLEWKKIYSLKNFSVYEDCRFLRRDTVHSDKSIKILRTKLQLPFFLLMQRVISCERSLHSVNFHKTPLFIVML